MVFLTRSILLLLVFVSLNCSVKEVHVPVHINLDESLYTVLHQDTLKNNPGVKRIQYREKPPK